MPNEQDFVLMLEAIDVSSGHFRLKEPSDHVMPVMRLNIRAKRHQGAAPVTSEALPPIYIEAKNAAALPSALLAALDKHLPEAGKAAREQLAVLLRTETPPASMN